MTYTAMTREEALMVIEEYYRYLRAYRMVHLFWDGLNQAVNVLGGEGDPILDHEEYVRMYKSDGITLRQVLEEEIRWAGNLPGEDHRIFPEPDKSLSAALAMALDEMERRWLQRHGAQLRNPDDGSLIPLTEDFYRRAVEACHTGGYNAATYELVLPDIDSGLWLAIWKDGHVDSGSPKSICACLAR